MATKPLTDRFCLQELLTLPEKEIEKERVRGKERERGNVALTNDATDR